MHLKNHFDVLVIGGGINGVGVAYELAKRGARVILCEQNDFASGTSSASSKLIHGGLRYLEHYEFRLVREALKEREVLMRIAPNLVTPMRFTLPHRPFLRPAWMIRCGLFLYDFLHFGRTLPASRSLKRPADSPLQAHLDTLFEYSDCWTDDSRLVITNAIAAREQGATLLRDTRCEHLSFDAADSVWRATLRPKANDDAQTVSATHVVNTTGPWMNRFFSQQLPEFKPRYRVRLVKGSHIIVPRIHNTQDAYILQNEDQRIVFVLPYLDRFSLIGTTDREYQGEPEDVAIDDWETDYLIKVVNGHFNRQLSRKDIVSSFSGVRPLLDDESSNPAQITRDYTLDLYTPAEGKSLVSVYGGKITTYRKLAEAVGAKLYAQNGTFANPAHTEADPLPGVAFCGQTLSQIRDTIRNEFPWLPEELLDRYSKSYGLRCRLILAHRQSLEDLGAYFGAGLYAAEVDYLRAEEWALNAEDILYRRSKLGLLIREDQKQALQDYLATQRCSSTATEPVGIC